MASTTAVILLTGLPGSGKSTLAKELLKDIKGAVHVDYDRIASSVYDEHDDNSRLDAWRKARSLARNILLDQLQKTPPISLIVMDDNFHLRSMRKTIYRVCQERICKGGKVKFGIIVFDTPIRKCLERNENRVGEARVSNDVIGKMQTAIEYPDAKKASWEANSITVGGGDEIDLPALLNWLELLPTVNPLPPERNPEDLERERQATHESRMHRLDQLTRTWVAQVGTLDKRSARKANQCRKWLLEKLKSNETLAPGEAVKFFCEEVCIGWDLALKHSLEAALAETVTGFS